ncbi:MAG: SDR family oxidoreductase [Bacteroidota bacterium]|jgi:NADP-dependent 3-hydroxy acid dehydrogenase YdfG|nr:SDR family oxidoreductase [Ignavibacteria bacterium]MCU7498516.1 SDR family oxidoreductase [Ignavibacteria bacterium]MCU7513534.1 SDR family oxidoreductase [Ignavibacteria bacterium]MCU7521903.1 SDR family oxidoreductase [Ignavibacteria bacterium]MCU7525249.1 SDR family oxidoreductase [Ignavibacteria bacterium]
MEALKNKVVFITGATSGIGKACAEEFAKAGSNLILCARRIDILNIISENIRKEFGVKVYDFKLDVRNRKAVESAIDSLPEEWKNIDILVNNAGLAVGMNKFYEDNPDNWDVMIDTNVKGLLYVSRAVVPLMVKRDSGHIINLGSIAGQQAYPKGSVYCATKHAVDAITKSLRMDLVETKIKVSSIDPGMVETNFSVIRFEGDAEKAKNVYRGLDPLVGKDIAETIVFMASRPAHVVIADVVIYPVHQASATVSYKKV